MTKKDSTSKNLQTKIFDLFDNKQYDPDLDTLKKKHKEEYFRQKHHEYKKKWKRVMIRFTHEELDEINAIAKQYNRQRAPLLKAMIFAYIRDIYVLPSDNQVRTLELMIRKIAQEVSESMRYIHLNEHVTQTDIELLQKKLYQLEIQVSGLFRHPPSLKLWLTDQINQDERFIVQIQDILNQIQDDY